MSERIVSPGVFTRERDLSFLPVGIGEIGAAIIGPTKTGPSFVPTVVRNFQEFENIFGSHTEDFYTSFTVREYLRSAGSVTVVKVGSLGGYYANSLNLIVNGVRGANSKVIATFAPSALNGEGIGSISGSLDATAQAKSAGINLMGTNATASLDAQTILEGAGGEGAFLFNTVGNDPQQPSIGSTAAPVYLYKHFRSFVSESAVATTSPDDATLTDRNIETTSSLSLELQVGGLDFSGGSNSEIGATISGTIDLDADDDVRVDVYQGSGSSKNLTANGCVFSAYKLIGA